MFIIFALQWAIIAVVLMGQPFLFKPPAFECSNKSSPGIKFPCFADEKTCANNDLTITPLEDSQETLVKTFGLFCDRANYITAVQASFFVCGAVGIMVFSYLADQIGRWIILAGSFALTAVMMFLASFMDSFVVFGVLLSICGIGINVYVTICFVAVAECSSKRQIFCWNQTNFYLSFTN